MAWLSVSVCVCAAVHNLCPFKKEIATQMESEPACFRVTL